MYAVLQWYTFDPTSSAELTRQIKDECVPPLRQMAGFVACYWLDSGAGAGAALSVFEDQASAAAALALAAKHDPAQLAALVGMREMLTGTVTVYANAGL